MTVIVFCREPEPGRVKTRLIPLLGERVAAQLSHAFTVDALRKAADVRAARIVIAGSAEGGLAGSSYFRRMARRFKASLIDQGCGHMGVRMARVLQPYAVGGAVLIGVDTPSMPVAMLRRNLAMLRRAQAVLGPSLDGGYYLVGVRGSVLDIFRGIRWGGRRVLDDTVTRLKQHRTRYLLGPAWYDVDRPSDLILLSEHLRLMITRARAKSRTRARMTAGSLHEVVPCPDTARLLAGLGLLDLSR